MLSGPSIGTPCAVGIKYIPHSVVEYGTTRTQKLKRLIYRQAVKANSQVVEDVHHATVNSEDGGYGDNLGLSFVCHMPAMVSFNDPTGGFVGVATPYHRHPPTRRGNQWVSCGIFGGAMLDIDDLTDTTGVGIDPAITQFAAIGFA